VQGQPVAVYARPMEPPGIIGRAVELARIDAALAAAAAGRARVILIAGEPGIGKTRLAREAAARARGRDFLVLEGRAHPVGADLAYAPVLEAFGRCLRAVADRRRAALVADLPELGRLFVGLGLPAPPALGDPALERTRLFEAVLRLVERLAADAPVLLVLDDLHWADRTTIELVHHLARGAEAVRLAIVATARSDPGEATDGFAAAIQSLRRLGLVDELAPPRLDAGEVAALAAGLLTTPAADEVLAAVAARASGVPLYVELLVRELAETGALPERPPARIRDTLAGRLERLGGDDRRVVEVLAVAGGATPHGLVAAVAGLDDARLGAAVDRLRAAGLVVEEDGPGAVSYGAGHPLVLEVVYADLAAVARRRLHLAFAAALDRGDADLDELARHYRGAGGEADPRRTLEVLLAAGERALALGAADEAAASLAGAVAIVRVRGGASLPDTLERLGDAWQRAGRGAGAIAVWREALGLGVDDATAGRLHHRLGAAELDRGRLDTAALEYAAALAHLGAAAPSRELAALHWSRTLLCDRTGDVDGLTAAAADLAAVADAIPSPPTRVQAEMAGAHLHRTRGEHVSASAAADRAIAAAGDDDRLAVAAHETAMVVAAERVDLAAVRRHADAALAVALRRGAPASQMRAHGYAAIAAYFVGDLDGCDRALASIAAMARRFDIPRGEVRGAVMRAMIRYARGDLDGADAALADGRARAGAPGLDADRHLASSFALVEGWLALERGDRAAAGRLAALLDGPGEQRAVRRAALAELVALAGDAATADALAARLVGDGGPAHDGLAARARAAAATARGDDDAARAAHAAAAAAFDRAGMRLEATRDRLAAIDPTAADAIARCQACLDAFEAAGARRWADRARRKMREAGGRPAPVRRAGPGGGPLSRRELEVAELYAQGLTTAEVAARLVISPHTAATHLQRIYQRLGIRSRAELTRYLMEQGPGRDY